MKAPVGARAAETQGLRSRQTQTLGNGVHRRVRQCRSVGEPDGRDHLVTAIDAHHPFGGRGVLFDVDLVEGYAPFGEAALQPSTGATP